MNETGHMLVARIAWDKMTPATQKAVLKLVADPNDPQSGKPTTDQDRDQFTAACYMDDIRPEMSKLHFDNQYIDAHGNKLERQAETPNGVTFFNDNVAILKDAKATQDAKAEALRYVMHLTGDLHQPLHCVDRVTDENPDGDRGGNLFPITWSSNFKSNNLHSYWDSAAGEFAFIQRPLDSAGTSKLNSLADLITGQFPSKHFETAAINDANPQNWADQSLKMAVSDCYVGIEPHAKPSAAYKQKTLDDMNSQTALAGYRMAALFNSIFDPASTGAALAMSGAHR
jgi:hypothetical protein